MFVNQDPYQNNIRRWLILMFSLIILIIAVGGLTRLTDSGLSITEWELFKGILPPFTSEKWNFYFDEYKQIPEFKSINYDMTLTEFKVIFYWEYIHRLIARLIGLFALIPLLIISLKYKKKLIYDFKYLSIFLLICIQGTVGWYMVTSGLVNNTDVSHYRLALHLSIALIILSINYDMTLSEFKVIFYWEYIHRLIARLIGLFALIPLIIISLKYKKKLISDFKYLSIFLLICVQGTVGWYMVTSGLVNNTDVSHYRLALHLSIALIILSINFWFILQTLKISSFKVHFNNSFLNFFLILIIFQIILGAFLAGMDGGLIYNSWPDMNGSFVPNDITYVDLFLFSSLDNPSVIQFYHRLTAYLLFIFLILLNYYTYKYKMDFKPVLILDLAILIQIVLGILTLITGVKITYASLHQLGSVFVLTSFLYIKYKNIIS